MQHTALKAGRRAMSWQRGLWGVARATLDKAHAISQGAGVTIAVLDTRIDQTHKELAGKTLARIDTVAIDPKINLPTSGVVKDHGTYVASVALRAAPQAKILPVRVLNEDGLSSLATVAEGIRRAADGGATVINMSLSTSSYSLVLEDAVAYAQRRGSVLVAAYGNEETNSTKVYPADFPGVLSVVAAELQEKRATFSNYSRAACVAAPGVKAVGAYTGDHFAIADGTSFAAPWVAGQAALLLAKGTAADRVGSQITLVSGK